MNPSLNLIIKNHTLASFWFHLYPTHWQFWNWTRFNRFFFHLCMLCFHFYSLLCFLFLHAWGVEYLIWVGHLVWGASKKALWEPLFIQLEFSGCLKNYADYIKKSREKILGFNHREKVGAMNVLVRASTVLIDAPYLLNLECNHYINNSKTQRNCVIQWIGKWQMVLIIWFKGSNKNFML